MKHEIALNSGDEYDALTRFRRLVRFRPGERARIKRQYRRRERRAAKATLMMGAWRLDYEPWNLAVP